MTFGPISGARNVTDDLMRHLGYEPTEHPEVAAELEWAAGDAMMEAARDVLNDHGMAPRDPYDHDVRI